MEVFRIFFFYKDAKMYVSNILLPVSKILYLKNISIPIIAIKANILTIIIPHGLPYKTYNMKYKKEEGML